MRLIHTLFTLLCVLFCVCSAAGAPYGLEWGTYLFLDDHLIENQKGLYLEQHQPQKLGQVISVEHEWESGIYFYTSFLQVSATEYRIYYTCFGTDSKRSNLVYLCMANSTDGIQFSKPLLGIVGYGAKNDTKNNIVFSFPVGGWPNTVWIDTNPDAIPSQKFKMSYDVADRLLRIAASHDGIHWKWLASPGIATQFADTQTVVLWDSHTSKYFAFGRRDESNNRNDHCPGNYNSYRNIALSESSTNMTGFGPASQIYSWDSLDPPCLDPYNPAAILYPNDPHIPSFSFPSESLKRHQEFILFPAYTLHLTNVSVPFKNPYTAEYGHNDNLLDIHLVHSVDGATFKNLTKEPFIPRGIGYRNVTTGLFTRPNSAWDSGFVFMSRGIFVSPQDPNYLIMYYYGTQLTHSEASGLGNAYFPEVPKGLGRLQIRRDGFASLTTNYNLPMPQAALTTKLMILPYETQCASIELQLNIETSVAGQVVVGLVDENNSPLAGFSQENCIPIVGNYVRVPVMWHINGNYVQDISKIASAQQPVSISITMSHTKLFAFEVVCVSQ